MTHETSASRPQVVAPPEKGSVASPPAAPGPASTAGARSLMAGIQPHVPSIATICAFIGIYVFYGFWLGDAFLDVPGRMFDINSSVPQLIMALGIVVCMSCHQFDLSVAAIANMSVFLVIGPYLKAGWPFGLTLALGLAVGVAAGLVNGLLVTKVRINAFIATLGTGGMFNGLTIVFAKGNIISPSPTTPKLPSWFSGVGSLGDFQQKVPPVVGLLLVGALVAAGLIAFHQRFPARRVSRETRRAILGAVLALSVVGAWLLDVVASMNWAIFILGVIALIIWVVMKYTVFGQSLFAVGGSVRAAMFAGIRTDRVTLSAFIVSGFCASLAGVMIASSQGSAVPHIADPLLLPTYAAAFLSTVLLSRGRFHVFGTIAGGIAVVWVASGLVEGGVSFTWTQVINGAVLITVVALSTVLRRKRV